MAVGENDGYDMILHTKYRDTIWYSPKTLCHM